MKTPIVMGAQRFAFAKHGAGAGVNSVREQIKPEARKLLENAAESPVSSARCVRQPIVSQVY